MAFPPFNKRGGVNQRRDAGEEFEQQSDSGGVSDGRDPRSLKGLGRVRPGSAPMPSEAGDQDDVSGLDQIGSGSYTGPSMAVTSYTSNGVYTGSHNRADPDPEAKRRDPDGWGGGYAPDNPEVLSKIFGVRM